jgi:enamine deaminase RidA (YjgF/YER057c/UK114 family)
MAKHFEVGPRMSQAVAHGGVIHIAGQVPDDRKTSVEDQTRQVLAKIDALLAQAGGNKSKLLSINVFLSAIGDFDRMNSVYDAWIDPSCPPARACVEGRLADPDIRVEMTAVGYID